MNKLNIDTFIQKNSPDGGFLQSEEWRKFQESVGRRTFHIGSENFLANIIEHALPVVGKYFYVPRGPVIPAKAGIQSSGLDSSIALGMSELINLAKKENAGWIRFDAGNPQILDLIRSNWRAVKSPHDMQPKEIFMIDIAKSEDQLFSEMKSKTRYNIKLAEKKGVRVFCFGAGCHPELDSGFKKLEIPDQVRNDKVKFFEEFLRLVRITSKRHGISSHSEYYYRKMFEAVPGLKLYIAEHEGESIAANLVLFYGSTATYLHGASDNEHRNVMAPYLLQWKAIQDAKKIGCGKYDFGGVKNGSKNSWGGITKFKTGFSPNTKPIEFPGSYDIVINPFKYNLYKIIQKIKSIL